MSMFTRIVESLHGAKIEGLAKTFTRLGRIGFWLQVVLGSIPLMVTFCLLALLQMLAAEVITLVLGLWLMFRTTQAAGEFPKAA